MYGVTKCLHHPQGRLRGRVAGMVRLVPLTLRAGLDNRTRPYCWGSVCYVLREGRILLQSPRQQWGPPT